MTTCALTQREHSNLQPQIVVHPAETLLFLTDMKAHTVSVWAFTLQQCVITFRPEMWDSGRSCSPTPLMDVGTDSVCHLFQTEGVQTVCTVLHVARGCSSTSCIMQRRSNERSDWEDSRSRCVRCVCLTQLATPATTRRCSALSLGHSLLAPNRHVSHSRLPDHGGSWVSSRNCPTWRHTSQRQRTGRGSGGRAPARAAR